MSNNNEPYTPIDCDLHSQYELAIMHRTQLRVVWRDPQGQDHVCNLLPIDLRTERGEEFLIGRDHTGQTIRLRLDRIHTARPIITGP
ncbi:MAG: transcriptional antiterminator, Rof [Gammaproteobacteria bacterium]|nr:transcriptional antiterminator, Rof [Gammaproteobacteria bacterium]